MTQRWIDLDRDTIKRRYDRIAKLIPLFDRLFFLPRGLRRKAVMQLGLGQADSVLEVGCGTGNSLRYLHDAVGSTGHIFGVDISSGMLSQAESCAMPTIGATSCYVNAMPQTLRRRRHSTAYFSV